MTFYRLLLRLYPPAFRRRYGAEMVEAFERLLERTRAERGAGGVALLWVRTTWDALRSGVAERLVGRAVDQEEAGMRGRVLFHFRQAAVSLRRARGYAAAFVLTLGLAIGVNSAVFSVVDGVLLEPLPFDEGDRILYLKQPVAAIGVENVMFSFMEVDDYRAGSSTLDEVVEFGEWEFTVLADGEPHRAIGGLVTSNYFDVLGMRPALGRLLSREDDGRGAEPVLLMTHAYWERVFGRDPSVVGRTLDLESLSPSDPYVPVRVVGVLEPGRHYTGSRRPDFYVNYATNAHYQSASMRDARGHRMTDIFARLAPGTTLDAARAELGAIADGLHRRYPEAYPEELGYGLTVVPWEEELTREGRSTFLFLMGTVGLILVLAAANVTNLTLTRLVRREGELRTRAALGADETDLRIHLTAENAMLGLGGALLGVLLAYASRDPLVAYASRFTVRAQEVAVDWTVLGATIGGGVLLAALLAWMPGLPVGAGTGSIALGPSRATGSRLRKRLQRTLVVAQLALSFTLLTGAGLLVRSLLALTAVDPGFRTEQILTVQTPVGPSSGPLPIELRPLDWDRMLEQIRSFPGVRSAAVAGWTPMSAPTPFASGVRIEGRDDASDRSHLSASNNVSPQYFETLGIPLLAGRTFGADDRRESAPVVILNASMARAHFGDEDPIGRHISISPDRLAASGGPISAPWLEVVGVVADSREYGLDQEGIHTYYRPTAQTTGGPAILVAHQGDTERLTQHIRDVIHGMRPDRAIEQARTMTALLEQDLAPSRLNAMLFGSFSVLALVIAALGVLATLAFSVSQRVREFGVRMALGADRRSILGGVLGEGALMVAVALVVGAGAALLLGQFLSSLLYEVDPVDAPSMITAATVLGAVALCAALLPALRATHVHPTEALRGD